MTIREAITNADLQRPNRIAESEKLAWLNELEGLVQTQILHLSTDALTRYEAEVSYAGTVSFPDAQTVLLTEPCSFRPGDLVKISGLTEGAETDACSAQVRSVSADGKVLTFESNTFSACGVTTANITIFADRRDTALIVPAPYDRIYEAYLMMRINLYMGEMTRYNNDCIWYNAVWEDFSKWFHRNHAPRTAETRGFFLTAYGLAVKNGFVGTEAEWLQSLKGEQGFGVNLRYSEAEKTLQWCSLGGGGWQNLLTLTDVQGSVVSQTLSAAQTAKADAQAAQAQIESMTAAVTPLAKGASPTVEKTVSNGAVKLVFGIPKGDTGDVGPRGPQGYAVTAVVKKSGTGAPGTRDVYSVLLNDEAQTEVGTFSVYHGLDGEGSGDMLKRQYDPDGDGLVDNAAKLGGQAPEAFASAEGVNAHVQNRGNPHGVTAAQVGADVSGAAASAVSTHNSSSSAHSAQLAKKAPLISPAFSGAPTAPTAQAGTNSTQIATTAFVTNALGAFSSKPFAAGTAAPENANLFWIDTGSGGILKYYNGTEWKTVASAYTE